MASAFHRNLKSILYYSNSSLWQRNLKILFDPTQVNFHIRNICVKKLVNGFFKFILAGEETPTSASWRGIANPPFFSIMSPLIVAL